MAAVPVSVAATSLVRQGCGVIAMAMGLRQLMMRGPAVLVAVWIGVTVPESSLAT